MFPTSNENFLVVHSEIKNGYLSFLKDYPAYLHVSLCFWSFIQKMFMSNQDWDRSIDGINNVIEKETLRHRIIDKFAS